MSKSEVNYKRTDPRRHTTPGNIIKWQITSGRVALKSNEENHVAQRETKVRNHACGPQRWSDTVQVMGDKTCHCLPKRMGSEHFVGQTNRENAAPTASPLRDVQGSAAEGEGSGGDGLHLHNRR